MLNVRLAVALAAISLLASNYAVAGIIYDIVPRHGISEGWSLDGGWIKTDGTIGQIWPENLLNWELRFTSPSGEKTISGLFGYTLLHMIEYEDYGSELPAAPPPMVATEEAIVLHPGHARRLTLLFANQDLFSEDFTGQAVGFLPALDSTVRLVGASQYCCGWLVDNSIDEENPVSPYGAFSSQHSQNVGPFDTPRGPLVLATTILVPEPATAMVLSVAVVTLIATLRSRRSPATHADM